MFVGTTDFISGSDGDNTTRRRELTNNEEEQGKYFFPTEYE